MSDAAEKYGPPFLTDNPLTALWVWTQDVDQTVYCNMASALPAFYAVGYHWVGTRPTSWYPMTIHDLCYAISLFTARS